MKNLVLDFYSGIQIPQADLSTLEYYGGIHDYNDGQQHSKLHFKVNTLEEIEQVKDIVLNQLYKGFRDEVKADWFKAHTRFEDYVKDKRPGVTITLLSGYRGMRNPFQWRLKQLES